MVEKDIVSATKVECDGLDRYRYFTMKNVRWPKPANLQLWQAIWYMPWGENNNPGPWKRRGVYYWDAIEEYAAQVCLYGTGYYFKKRGLPPGWCLFGDVPFNGPWFKHLPVTEEEEGLWRDGIEEGGAIDPEVIENMLNVGVAEDGTLKREPFDFSAAWSAALSKDKPFYTTKQTETDLNTTGIEKSCWRGVTEAELPFPDMIVLWKTVWAHELVKCDSIAGTGEHWLKEKAYIGWMEVPE